MDTVSVLIHNPHTAVAIQKGATRLGYQSGRFRGKAYDSQRSPPGYRNSIYGLAGQKYFHVAFDPYSLKKAPVVLMMHLSQHKSLRDLKKWLDHLCGDFTNDVFDGELHRLDMCVDVAVPLDELKSAVSQPGVVVNERFMSRRGDESIYFGAKPRRTIAYQKKVERCAIDWIPAGFEPAVDRYGFSPVTRVEVRTWAQHRPIQKLAELEKLRRVNPFSHLQILKIDDALLGEVSNKKRHIIDAFKYQCLMVGAQKARANFSEQGNFGRNIGQHLTTCDLNLKMAWLVRLNRFLSPSNSRNDL